jgi:hypothetical protein
LVGWIAIHSIIAVLLAKWLLSNKASANRSYKAMYGKVTFILYKVSMNERLFAKTNSF